MGEETRPLHNEIGWVHGLRMVGEAVGLEGKSSPSFLALQLGEAPWGEVGGVTGGQTKAQSVKETPTPQIPGPTGFQVGRERT